MRGRRWAITVYVEPGVSLHDCALIAPMPAFTGGNGTPSIRIMVVEETTDLVSRYNLQLLVGGGR